jgi:integration host factor subunit alpha
MSKAKYCLTKAELAETIYTTLPIEKQKASELVEDFIELMKEGLEQDKRVMLSGFGTFLVNSKRPRRGRNPQTGDALILRARNVVKFKPSQILKNAVNGEKSSEQESDIDEND